VLIHESHPYKAGERQILRIKCLYKCSARIIHSGKRGERGRTYKSLQMQMIGRRSVLGGAFLRRLEERLELALSGCSSSTSSSASAASWRNYANLDLTICVIHNSRSYMTSFSPSVFVFFFFGAEALSCNIFSKIPIAPCKGRSVYKRDACELAFL
jgi:hypothetical protein